MFQPSKTAFAAVSRPPYDDLTILVHWASAFLVLAQFATALSIDRVADPALAARLLLTHRSTGVGLWMLVALRLLWRFTGMRLPPFPPTMARWHIAGVHASEYGLYALLLSQPLTGLAWSLYRGRAFELLLWTIPPLLGRDKALADIFHSLHLAGAVTLAGVIGVHASAALFHRFVLKDGVLGSMLPRLGRRAQRL
jgi:cytochrome b561